MTDFDKEDIDYFIREIENQAGVNQCVVEYNGKCCKIEREDYFPDENGLIVFHKKTDWVDEGYSVAEMLELLKRFRSRIKKIQFEEVMGTIQNFANVYESYAFGRSFQLTCIICVGDGNGVMHRVMPVMKR